jgi:hypothetical protein
LEGVTVIRIRYARFPETDLTEVWLDGSVQAVPAEPYAAIDEGQGGITRGDIKDADIKTLDQFEPGAEVFVASDDPEDVLDDSDSASERDTKIFWRARLVRDEPTP